MRCVPYQSYIPIGIASPAVHSTIHSMAPERYLREHLLTVVHWLRLGRQYRPAVMSTDHNGHLVQLYYDGRYIGDKGKARVGTHNIHKVLQLSLQA